ncbi:hypothetical protein Btru_072015 [Bulinus truncatus]|nr:hypothetical protein Btru_072015 [Bulinus truncatus]
MFMTVQCLVLLLAAYTKSEYLELMTEGVQVIVLPANTTLTAWVKSSFQGLSFIQIQMHVQFRNISLSTESSFSHSSTKTGSSVGMVEVLKPDQQSVTWYIRVEGTENVTAVCYLDFHDPDDPLPGGCNQVFNLEVDPSIVLLPRPQRTDVWFQWANLATPIGVMPYNCEDPIVRNTLTYDAYVYFLASRDQSQDEFISGVKKMLKASDIVSNGIKVSSLSDGSNSKSLVALTSEANQGVVHSVVVTRKDTGHQAAYITAVTYSCNYLQGDCTTKLIVGEIILAVVLGFFGLFLILTGHRFFKFTQFIFGYMFTSLLIFIGMSAVHSFDDSGNIEWWNSETNYSLAFICVILIFTVGLMAFSTVLSITSCSLVGSFLFLMAVGIPLRASLRNIFLNSLYHQTLTGYVEVKVIFPASVQDIFLFTVWPVLVIMSISWQWYREKRRPAVVLIPTAPIADEEDFEQISSYQSNNNSDESARLLPSDCRVYGATVRSKPENNVVT